MEQIKAVLFDLDGTLSHHIPDSGDVFVEYLRSLGFEISDEAKTRSEHWTHFYFANSFEIQKDSKAYADERAFWRNFTKRRLVSLGFNPAVIDELALQVSDYMGEAYASEAFVPEDAFPLLDSLKSAGIVMGVASNREKNYQDKLKEMKLDSYFSFAIAGGEIKAFKPDLVFFEQMLKQAGVSATETIYIGDNYFADVLGARRAGITPILYDRHDLFAGFDCARIRSFDEFVLRK